MRRTAFSVLFLTVMVSLAAASPAGATFPGTNGRIVYVKDGHVASVMPDGTGNRLLTEGPSDYMEQPHCSPDGRWVTFSGQTASLEYDIWIVRSNGQNLRRVTKDATSDFAPSFSPDGEWIVFSRDRGTTQAIFVMRRDGDNRHLLFDAPGDQQIPVYSPNGSRIAFQTRIGVGPPQIWVMRADGTRAHAITTGPNEHYTPSWTPSGDRIVMMENNFVNRKITSRLPDGTGRRVITTSVASVDTAVVSPNGKRLAITDGGPQLLYTQPIGGNPTPIGSGIGYGSLDWCAAI